MPNFYSHLTFTAQYEHIQDIFSAFMNTIKTKNKSFKALDTNSVVHCN